MPDFWQNRARQWREEAVEEGRREGREEGERDALVRLAERRFGGSAGRHLADALGGRPSRETLAETGDLIFNCETTEEFVTTQRYITWVRDALEKAREEGRRESRGEGERDALVRLAGRRFGGYAGQRLWRALDGDPSREMLIKMGDLLLACDTTEELIKRLGRLHI